MQVEQPSFMRSRLFPPVFVAAVLAMGFLAYNLYYAPFMKNLALWVFGVLVIYWFSVSGGMHNIIRGVPMYYPDQNGQVKVCYSVGPGVLWLAIMRVRCAYSLAEQPWPHFLAVTQSRVL